jgi:hypothetical protein
MDYTGVRWRVMSEQTVDAFCEKCGQTFKTFLQQMADKNLRVVCPKCAEQEECDMPKVASGGWSN